jgi:hypothetical protein
MDPNKKEEPSKDSTGIPDANNRPTEIIIQPINPLSLPQRQKPALINTPKLDTSSIYPNATASSDTNYKSSAEALALHEMEEKSQLANKPVSLRVKTVLVIGIVLALSSIYLINAGIGRPYGTFVFILGMIQLSMSLGLLLSNNVSTVSLLLKIFLVLQLISLFTSLANPAGLLISGIGAILLFYAYSRVKSLPYY